MNVYFWNINNLRTQSKIYKVTVKEKRADIRRKKIQEKKNICRTQIRKTERYKLDMCKSCC